MSSEHEYPDVSEMSREGLEDEVSNLRETAQDLECRLERLEGLIDTLGATSVEEAGLGDIMLAGVPAGQIIKKNRERNSEFVRHLFNDDNTDPKHLRADREQNGPLRERLGSADQDGGVDEAVRDRMLPVHRMAVDIRRANEDVISAASKRRAALLFSALLKVKTDGSHEIVDKNPDRYVIRSASAVPWLQKQDSSMPETGGSTVFTRAGRELQSLTKTEDCDCEDPIDECPHGLVTFNSDRHENCVTVDKARLTAYLQFVSQDTEDGVDTTDDGVDGDNTTPEDPADTDVDAAAEAAETFDRLEEATHGGEPN